MIVPRYLVVIGAACLSYLLAYATFASALFSLAPDDPRHAGILSYLVSGEEVPSFLSDAEASHMADVRRLVRGAFVAHVVALGVLIGAGLALARSKPWLEEWIGRVLRAAGWALVGVAGFLLLAALLSFGRLFVLFHAVLFPQGNWLFPLDSALIEIYPEAYFQGFAAWWLAGTILLGLLALLLSALLQRMRGHERAFRGSGRTRTRAR